MTGQIVSSYPIRTRLTEDIVGEVVLPDRQTGKVAVIATGLPSMPSKGELLRFLARHGYVAILPRYRGTWESDGFFLEHSPAKDICDTIDALMRDQSVYDVLQRNKVPIRIRTVHLFGFSFGGPAVLLNSTHPAVKKIVAVSPVLDWRKEGEDEPFDAHIDFVTRGFGGAYRVRNPHDWYTLIETSAYNPLMRAAEIDGKKVYIIHAKDDRIVPYEPLFDFAQKTGSTYYLKPHGGHSLRLSHGFLWNKASMFLRK